MSAGGPGASLGSGGGAPKRRMGGIVGSGEDGDEGGAIFAEINITPLTDIFLVLLIIFMVTSSVMSQVGVPVNLPGASAKTAETQPDGVIVTLQPDGSVQVNGESMPWPKPGSEQPRPAEFGIKVKAAFGKMTSRLVILEGDERAFLGNAVGIMDEARKAGAERFAIATKLAK